MQHMTILKSLKYLLTTQLEPFYRSNVRKVQYIMYLTVSKTVRNPKVLTCQAAFFASPAAVVGQTSLKAAFPIHRALLAAFRRWTPR